MLNVNCEIDAAIFEQAAMLWSQHPVPMEEAIAPWTQVFCARRDQFQGDESEKKFQRCLGEFLAGLFDEPLRRRERGGGEDEVESWLKLAAFIIRTRNIKLGGGV